jgi:uncharacterized membrane protein
MPHTPLGWVHVALALGALVAGAAVAIAEKGTPRHLVLGRTYGWLMLGVNGTAFMIFGLFGRFGPFHVAAFFSLLTVAAGWIPARSRSSHGWVERHAYFMSGSYVGLLAAAAAETLSRIPDSPFWGMVIFATVAVTAVGLIVMRWTLPAALAPWRR